MYSTISIIEDYRKRTSNGVQLSTRTLKSKGKYDTIHAVQMCTVNVTVPLSWQCLYHGVVLLWMCIPPGIWRLKRKLKTKCIHAFM